MQKIPKSVLLGLSLGLPLSALLYYFLHKKSGKKHSSFPETKHLDEESATIRRSQIIDNVNYNLTLNLKKENFSGKVKIYFKATGKKDIFIDYEGTSIVKYVVNGKELDHAQLWNKHYIQVPKENILAESTNIVEIDYATDYRKDGCGLHSFTDTDQKQYLYSQGEPYYIHNLFPCFDQPDIKGTWTLEVNAPEEWVVISNEPPKDKHTQNGVTNWVFGKTPKISSYLYAVCAGPFLEIKSEKTYRGIQMSMYVRESLYKHLKATAVQYFEMSMKVMEFYEKFFDFPYPFTKYDHVFCPEFNVGAMEHPGCVTMNDNAFIFKEEYTKDRMSSVGYVIAHEMAHMWFGNLVTMKWWNDLWLNESFADFISLYAMDQCVFEGVELSDFKRMFYNRKQWGYNTDQASSTHPIAGEVKNTEAALHIFDGITYSKGASILYQLLHLVTPQKFSKAISNYFKEFQWSNTILDDFIKKMDDQFKDLNFNFTLVDWNKDFIQTAGMNQISGEFDYFSKSSLKIIQKPVLENFATLRFHKIQVAFFTEDGNYTLVDAVVNKSTETNIQLNLQNKEIKAFFLNAQDQQFIKVKLDKVSYIFFSQNVHKITNILTKSMIWRTLYEMIKDGEVSSKKYIETIINNLDTENDSTIISDALNNGNLCLGHWTPKNAKEEIASSLFKQTQKLIAKTTIKQSILVLKEKLFSFANKKEDLDFLLNWLNGEDFCQISLSTKDKWKIVSAITGSKHFGKTQKLELIAKVKEEDKTEEGIQNEESLKARLAVGAERKKIWEGLTDPKSQDSLFIRIAKMKGINHDDDGNWHLYDDFFKEIEIILENNSQEFVKTFIHICFPSANDAEVLKKLVKNCEELIPKLKKDNVFGKTMLVENKEIMEKRLRAFACYEAENK